MSHPLDDAQKRHMIEHGYVVARGAVPQEHVDAARRTIHHDIGEKGIDPAKLPVFRAQSYCPDIRQSPAIMNLFHGTAVRTVAESLVGELAGPKMGQIALRFPMLEGERRVRGGHIDGIPTPTNGVPPGTLAHFTMLCGVFLADLPDEFAGNFTVYPGSHERYGAYFRDHDPSEMVGGMPPVEMGEPLQITGKAGDAVFVHYLTAHTIAPNLSPNIRYAIFFRVFNARHGGYGYRPEAVRDMWLDWDGLHGLLGR